MRARIVLVVGVVAMALRLGGSVAAGVGAAVTLGGCCNCTSDSQCPSTSGRKGECVIAEGESTGCCRQSLGAVAVAP